ncbi:MAG: acetate/propionate family kinase [Steroidobacteraceae bacterium]
MTASGMSPSRKPPKPLLLTINGGSSSIKFALFEPESSMRKILSGSIDRIGRGDARLTVKSAIAGGNLSRSVDATNYAAAAKALMEWLGERVGHEPLAGIGHRVVHGGPKYWQPQRITAALLGDLRDLSAYDPEHLPEEILLAETMQQRFPHVPQIACFDTAFHHDMPRIAQLLAIPRRFESMGVRRYGFHGLSYAYLMQELERLAGAQVASGRVILAHLGSGASMAAVHAGKSMDTSMAFTPAAGLMMSTRCGDLDPGLVSFLAKRADMNSTQFDHMANHESGLLGISQTSADMQELLERESHDVRAAEAVGLFCYQAKKWIGAYSAALQGLDTLIFAGGIGENAPLVRSRIVDGLSFLGIELNAEHNSTNDAIISSEGSRVTVRVIRTDESLMIAQSLARVLGVLP